MNWHIIAVAGFGYPGQRPIPCQPWATPKVTRRHGIPRAESPAQVAAVLISDVPWGGLTALNSIGVIVTHGVAMGWHVAGPLALKSAKSFTGIAGQFPVDSKSRSESLRMRSTTRDAGVPRLEDLTASGLSSRGIRLEAGGGIFPRRRCRPVYRGSRRAC